MLLRLFLRFVPWWIFVLMSFMITPILGSLVVDSFVAREQIKQARDGVAPVPVALHQLDGSQITNPIGEIAISGQLVGTLHAITTDTDRDVVLTMVPAEDGRATKIAFVVDEDEVLGVLETLGAATDQNGQTILRGIVSRSFTDRTRVEQALKQGSSTPFDGDLIIVDPFLTARDVALDDLILTKNVGIGVGILLIVLINGVAVIKFRASRRRRRAKKAETSVVVAQTKQTSAAQAPVEKATVEKAPAQRTPKSAKADPFRDGPIVTIGRKM